MDKKRRLAVASKGTTETDRENAHCIRSIVLFSDEIGVTIFCRDCDVSRAKFDVQISFRIHCGPETSP